MTINAEEAIHQPISTDAQIEARVVDLIGRANRRQVWLLLIDGEDRQLPIIVPMADYPATPYEGNAEAFADRIAALVEQTDAAAIIVVWERRLPPGTTEADRAWARELAAACHDCDVTVRAQLISHRDGVRWFSPDDYL